MALRHSTMGIDGQALGILRRQACLCRHVAKRAVSTATTAVEAHKAVLRGNTAACGARLARQGKARALSTAAVWDVTATLPHEAEVFDQQDSTQQAGPSSYAETEGQEAPANDSRGQDLLVTPTMRFTRSRQRRELHLAHRLLKLHRMEGSAALVTSFESAFDLQNAAVEARAIRKEVTNILEAAKRHREVWLAQFKILAHRYSTWTECHNAMDEARRKCSQGEEWLLSRDAWPLPVLETALSKLHTSKEASDALHLLSEMFNRGSLLSIEVIHALLIALPRMINGHRATHLVEDATSLALQAVSLHLRPSEARNRYTGHKLSHSADICYDLLELAVRNMCRSSHSMNRRQTWRIIDFIETMSIDSPRSELHLTGERGTRILLRLFLWTRIDTWERPSSHALARARLKSAFYEGAGPLTSRPRVAFGLRDGDMDGYMFAFRHLLRNNRRHVRLWLRLALQDFVLTNITHGTPKNVNFAFKIVREALEAGALPATFTQSALYLRLLCARDKTEAAWNFLGRLQKEQGHRLNASDKISPSRIQTCIFFMQARDRSIDAGDLFRRLLDLSHTPSSGLTDRDAAISTCKAMLHGFLQRGTYEGAVAGVRAYSHLLSLGADIDADTISRVSTLTDLTGKLTGGAESISAPWGDAKQEGPTDEYKRRTVHVLQAKAALREGRYADVYQLYAQRRWDRNSLWRSSKMMQVLLDAAHLATQHPDSRSLARGDTGLQAMESNNRDGGAGWDDLPPAMRACLEFRRCVLAQYPEVARETHPFDWRVTSFEGQEDIRHQVNEPKLHRWLSSLATTVAMVGSDAELVLCEKANKTADLACTTWPLNLTSPLFHKYFLLTPMATPSIISVSSSDHLHATRAAMRYHFEALAWMKALRIKPSRELLLLLCTYVDAITPAILTYDEHDSAAGPLHAYLADWLGPEVIPSRSEVGRFVREDADAARIAKMLRNAGRKESSGPACARVDDGEIGEHSSARKSVPKLHDEDDDRSSYWRGLAKSRLPSLI